MNGRISQKMLYQRYAIALLIIFVTGIGLHLLNPTAGDADSHTGDDASVAPIMPRKGSRHGEHSGRGSREDLGRLQNARNKLRSLFHFEPAEFEESWHHVLSNSGNEQDKLALLGQMVMRMSSLGHPEEALRLILRDFGEGASRASLIESCIASINDLSQIEKCFLLLPSEGDREAAKRSALRSFARDMASRHGAINIASYPTEFLGDDARAILVNAAHQYYIQIKNDLSQGREQALNTIMNMGFDGNAKLELLSRISHDLPFEAWKHFSKALDTHNLESHEIRSNIVERMMQHDPQNGLAEITRSNSPKDLEVAFHWWGNMNIDRASEWLHDQASHLSLEQREFAILGLSRSLVKSGKFAEVNAFLSGVQDSERKRNIEGIVWTGQRDALRSEVHQHPDRTLGSLAAGTSDFSGYWLEEAMSTWIAKDFHRAVEWHEKNWNSLPAAKAQYIAAAYAKHALQQQRIDTARQWAALIHDPKTKARIDEMVAKGAAGQ
jgi:hypothetical protein